MAFEKEIKLGVDASRVKSGTSSARSALEQLMATVQKLDTTLNQSSKSFTAVGSSAQSASRSVRNFSTQTESSLASVHSSITRTKALFASLGVVLTGRTLIDVIDNYTLLNARLKLVTKSTAEFNVAQKDVLRISQETRANITETVQLYTRISRALDGTSTSMADVATITSTVNKALIISGANAGEARASMLQLSQAFNKGKLDGDEFRTVMELMPPVAKAIAKEMGVTRGALLDLAPEGKITAEIMSKALVAASDEISESFKKVPVTIGQAFTLLGNQITVVAGKATSELGIGSGLVTVIRFLADNMANLLSIATLTATYFATRFVAGMVGARLAMLAATTQARALLVAINLIGVRGAIGVVISSLTTSVTSLAGAFALARGAVVGLLRFLGPVGVVASAVTIAVSYLATSNKELTESEKLLNAERENTETLMRKIMGLSNEQIEVQKKAERQALNLAEARLTQAKATLAAASAEQALLFANLDDETDTSDITNVNKSVSTAKSAMMSLKESVDQVRERLLALDNQQKNLKGEAVEELSKKYTKLIEKLKDAEHAAGRSAIAASVLNNVRSAGLATLGVEVDENGNLIGSYNEQITKIATLTQSIYTKNAAYKESAKALKDAKKKSDEYNKSLEKQSTGLVQSARIENLRLTQGNMAANIEKVRIDRKAAGLSLDQSLIEADAERITKAQDLNAQYEIQKDLASEIDSSFESALEGAIKGTTSLGDAFRNLAVDIAAAVAKALALQAITSAIGGGSSIGGSLIGGVSSLFGGFFAEGGSPPVGKTSIVGENGPELFVPSSSGTIVPNYALGGSGGSVNVSTPVQVNIINQGTPQEESSTQTSTGPDGSSIIDIIIKDSVNKGISRGSFDGALSNTYGLNRRGS